MSHRVLVPNQQLDRIKGTQNLVHSVQKRWITFITVRNLVQSSSHLKQKATSVLQKFIY